jgi:hypothetical protein
VTPLFGYGTFCRPDWRRAILGAEYPAVPARVHGWRRTATPSGYLSLVPAAADAAPVAGALIELDATGWAIADAWEEVPLYARIAVVAHASARTVAATMYVYAEPERTVAVPGEPLTLLDERAVAAAIAAFGPTMEALRAAMRP